MFVCGKIKLNIDMYIKRRYVIKRKLLYILRPLDYSTTSDPSAVRADWTRELSPYTHSSMCAWCSVFASEGSAAKLACSASDVIWSIWSL